MYPPNFLYLKHHPRNAQMGCCTSQTDAKRTKMQQFSKKCLYVKKNEGDCTWDGVIPLHMFPFFVTVNKFNWYWETFVHCCLSLGCINHIYKVYGLSDFGPDASRVPLLESRRKHVAWWTYMITSWHGIALLINAYLWRWPIGGGFPKQNTSNGKKIFHCSQEHLDQLFICR